MKLRTFEEHHIRPVQSLCGRWQFAIAESETPPHHYERTIQVPAAWESLPSLEAYRGAAWYRTRVTGRAGRALRLVFGGVSHLERCG